MAKGICVRFPAILLWNEVYGEGSLIAMDNGFHNGHIHRWSVLIMKTEVTSRAGSMRPVQRFFVAAYLIIMVGVTYALMPFASPNAWADDADDFRIWGNVTARGNFGFVDPDFKRSRWTMEVQPRTRESGKEMDQLLIRPGIGYALTDRSTVWIGYAHVTNYPVVGNDEIEENRLWQQYQWSGPTPLGAFTSPNQAGTTLAGKRRRYRRAVSSIVQIQLAVLFSPGCKFRSVG